LVENALFATLDPTVRRLDLPDGRRITLSDTVGFVRHLPHQLVEAFRSTLEEVADADLILHVVDASHADPESQIAAVREVLAEIDAAGIPEIVVLNKSDAADPDVLARLQRREPHHAVVSARTGEGIEQLLDLIADDLPVPDHVVDVLVPYDRGDVIDLLHRRAHVLATAHTDAGTLVKARVDAHLLALLEPFVTSERAAPNG
jgi:GTP-binding protein HflX